MKRNSINQKPGFLFVLPWDIDGIGGVNEVVLNLYNAIEKAGKFRPIIMVNSWDYLRPEMYIIDNREVVKLRLRSPYSSKKTLLRLLSFSFLLPFNVFILARFLKDQNIKVINPHYPELPLFILSFLKKTKLFKGRLIISLHGTDVRSLNGVTGLRKILWYSMLKACYRIVACSYALKNEAKSILQIDDNRFSVIHNGVSDSFVISGKMNENYCFNDQLRSSKYILNVATFEYKKGQDILIKSFNMLSSKFSDYKLVIIGRRTEYFKNLKRLVTKLNLKDRIIFFSDIPHDNISQFFEFAQFFVLPSRIEPFGIVLLEAGVFKLPVIASKVGGVSEIIQNGISGRLVQPDNIQELRDEMEKFCSNESAVKFFGTNLFEHVKKNFSWKKTYRHYVSLCE